MNMDVYNPKELLSILVEIESKLKLAVEKHCPHSDLSITIDFDKTLENFFDRHDIRGNEVGFISTQIALQHLRREIEKAREIVVDTNDLRAWNDYTNRGNEVQTVQLLDNQNKGVSFFFEKGFSYIMLAITLSCIIMMCYVFFFVAPL